MADVTDSNNNNESCSSEDPENEALLLRKGLPSFKAQRCTHICNGHCSPHTPLENALNAYYKLVGLLQKSTHCDAVLRTSDGGVFHVHRVVLMADSEYFRALFTTTLHKYCETDVIIHNVRAGLLKFLLHFMYTRKVWLHEDIVIPVLEAADYLGLVALRNECTTFIESQISPQNVLSIRQFARDWFCHELHTTAHQFLMRNFADVTRDSDELLELNLIEILSIFGDDELNVKNEEVVWEAAIRWIDHNPENRNIYIVNLLRQIRTGLMETQYFMEHVKDHTYVHGNEGCRPIIIETLRFLLQFTTSSPLSMTDHVPTPGIAKPRIPYEIMFAIGGWSGGAPTSYIETYDTRADRWVRVEEVDPTGPRAYHGTVAIGFEIFVIGGFDGIDYFNSCRAFNAVTKQWRNVAAMHCRRCYVSVALIQTDKIYAMGGYDGHHRQNTCERYDLSLNQWTNVCPMNCQRSDASATSINDKIYICGGFNGIECLNSCECYSPDTNQWTTIASMRHRRSGVACVSYHNFLYVIGGFNGISRMASGEKYNPENNSWTIIPDMYNPRSNFAIEVIDELLFCIGGFTGTSTTYNVECYDERTNEWYEATDMNIFRSALSACVMTGLPNIYDFIHQHRDRLMEEKRQKLIAMQQPQLSPIEVAVAVTPPPF
ncbi:kelch-like protein 10 [Folsomia candida]|uniref:Kelch-like protein diablo n=1 Tax=Folsomia candida TaxID=158441 RepID=A0A226ELQ3_FOLCA|nr:kelch-like protein 10 [Folsomia candida]OXA57496.1 Kelch-like protein 10 [Folsomia candida]